ncbi:MAG TPA: pyridoxal-dependent decarboxylase [Gaiellaceae bacterium]|nr:pyridoxal-dependent decarboxylase [Gaiellaceae bacterium]
MATRDLFQRTAEIASDYLESLEERPVRPEATVEELRAALGGPLPEEPSDARAVVEQLARDADPGLMGIPSGRFFGFVMGGALPASIAADWLTSAWGQNAGLLLSTPAASVVEEVAGGWLKDLLGLPQSASFGLVTGGQMAHFTCLAAARHHLLAATGWDVERDGLAGAPPIRVVAGANRHGTLDRALRFLGIGTAAIRPLRVDDQGRVFVDALREELGRSDGPTIACVQAGDINTGAFDDLEATADAARAAGAWLHVDGAIGLWAAASPSLRRLTAGMERADSWVTDAHKLLSVPYDSGIALCAHPDSHRAALGARAAYLLHADEAVGRDPVDFNPEHSRRARGFALYAALRALGRTGVVELVDRSHARARSLAEGLAELPGCEVLNDVVFNQVLVRFEDDAVTDAVLAGVQASGEAWMSGTTRDGRKAIRLSVSNWQTSERDVERTLAAFAAARMGR